MLIDYFKLRDSALDPVRANPSDAGLDVFYCPSDERDSITIPAGGSVVLETGLKFGVPHGFMLEVKNRSSVASKRHLIVGARVIDPGYNGELYVSKLTGPEINKIQSCLDYGTYNNSIEKLKYIYIDIADRSF